MEQNEAIETRRTNLDHLSGNESDTALPALRRVVQHVVNAEAIVLLGQLVQLVLQQDVLRVDVGEDQVHLGGVVAAVTGTVADDGLDDLQHGSDTRATSDHTNVSAHVGSVDHGALRSADLHGLSNLQAGQVLGDVALRVLLDEEVEVARLVVRGDRSVGAHDLLGLTGDGGREGDVLADGQTQYVSGTRQGEAVDGDIVGDDSLLLELELLELVGVQHLARTWRPHIVSIVTRVATAESRTVVEQLPPRQDGSQRDSIWDPFLPDDRGAHDQQKGRDVNPIDVLGGQEAAEKCMLASGPGTINTQQKEYGGEEQ